MGKTGAEAGKGQESGSSVLGKLTFEMPPGDAGQAFASTRVDLGVTGYEWCPAWTE